MIDGMTLAEAGEIFAYWERDPPVHLIAQTIARMLGWTPRPAPGGRSQFEDLAAAPPPGLAIVGSGNAGMPAPILDPVALRARNRALAAEMKDGS